MRRKKILKLMLNSLYGKICLLYSLIKGRKGVASLSLDFGKPSLSITGPYKPPNPSFLDNRRIVSIRGEWILDFYMAHWKIIYKDKVLARSTSSRRMIEEALDRLTGQKILDINIRDHDARGTFVFDLNCVLEVWYKKGLRNKPFLNISKKDDFLLNFKGNGKFDFSNDKVDYVNMDIKDFNGKGILK